MSSERISYLSTPDHLVTTLPVPTTADFEIMQIASLSHPHVVLDVLPTDTPTQVRNAEEACMQTARHQGYDRISGTYIPVRSEVIASAVGRVIANGGCVVQLWAVDSKEIALPTVLRRFWDEVAYERRVRNRARELLAA